MKKKMHSKKKFELGLLRESDIFWIFRASSKRMILKWESYNASDFEQKLLHRVIFKKKMNVTEFHKKMAFKKSCHETWCSVKATFSHSPCFSETHNFELKVLQCIRIRTKTFTTFPICNNKLKTGHKLKNLHSQN